MPGKLQPTRMIMCQNCPVQQCDICVTEKDWILLPFFSEYLVPLFIPSDGGFVGLPSYKVFGLADRHVPSAFLTRPGMSAVLSAI